MGFLLEMQVICTAENPPAQSFDSSSVVTTGMPEGRGPDNDLMKVPIYLKGLVSWVL